MNILKDKRIIFLGSSVTYGEAAGGYSFVDEIARTEGCHVIKEAVSGTTLVDVTEDSYISRLKRMSEDICPDLFVCQLSTNDAIQNKPLGIISDQCDTHTVIGAIEYIISYVRATWHCPVAFYTNPKFDNECYGEMVQSLYGLRDKYKIHIIDLWNESSFCDATAEEKNRYMADPVHPTKEGYVEWFAPFITKCLMDILSGNSLRLGKEMQSL